MARPEDSSQPRFAKGCRWSSAADAAEEGTIVFPEGAIKVHGTGKAILERCNGENTLSQIVDELQKLHSVSDPAQIRDEIGKFLETLQQKRIVDY
jgi:coenzyme PQQ biosynthesis protein PqqD